MKSPIPHPKKKRRIAEAKITDTTHTATEAQGSAP